MTYILSYLRTPLRTLISGSFTCLAPLFNKNGREGSQHDAMVYYGWNCLKFQYLNNNRKYNRNFNIS